MPFCVVLRIRSVYMGYREREYTVLVLHLSKYNFVKQSSLGAASLTSDGQKSPWVTSLTWDYSGFGLLWCNAGMQFPLFSTRTAFGSVQEVIIVFFQTFFAFKIFVEATSFWKDQLHSKISS